MLRLTNLRLPLDHDDAALRAAIVARLRVKDAQLLGLSVFKRSWDARKKSAFGWVYTVDCRVSGEEPLLARFARAKDEHVRATEAICVAPMPKA